MTENLEELEDATRVAANVRLAHSAVAEVLHTIQRLVKAAKHAKANDSHLSLSIINDLKAQNDLRAFHMCEISIFNIHIDCVSYVLNMHIQHTY
jgi:hypothetical protein